MGIPLAQKHVKGPKWLPFVVGLPAYITYAAASAAFGVVSVGVALLFFQQLVRINAVVYYSTSVFRSAAIQSDVAASALVGASNVFGRTVASLLMDKQGRKSYLLISFAGMVAAARFLDVFAICLSQNPTFSSTLDRVVLSKPSSGDMHILLQRWKPPEMLVLKVQDS